MSHFLMGAIVGILVGAIGAALILYRWHSDVREETYAQGVARGRGLEQIDPKQSQQRTKKGP